MSDKNISTSSGGGAAARTPAEIANDPSLSNARKIELLGRYKEDNAGTSDHGVIRDADLELDKLLELNSLANDGR